LSRKLANWLKEYVTYIAPSSESPLDYHTWSALTVVSATLRKHVYISRGTWKLYPNLFTVLVGRPGIGKGSAINPALGILRDADTANLLSDRVTIEYVLEKLSKGWPHFGIGKPGKIAVGIDHSCLILSRELSVFVTASQFTLPILTDLWDANDGKYIYGTRGKGEFAIEDPCVCLLGGSTQEWLISSIPPSAIGGGFTRRVNFVVAYDRERFIPWPNVSNHSNVRVNLVDDLKEIGKLSGEFRFHPDTIKPFEEVYTESMPGIYDDAATTSYKTSKWAQVSKLAMCVSAARSDNLIITKEDFNTARLAVESVAVNVPRVFRGVGESELVKATTKILEFIEAKGFASRDEMLKAHWRDVTSDDLDRVLATLKEAYIIREYTQGRKTMYQAVEKFNVKPKGVVP
jgi:hypothetical protein